MLNLFSIILLVLLSTTSYAVINGAAVTVSGTTLCNNGTIERTVAGTMTTTCGAGWSVGALGTPPISNGIMLADFENAITEMNPGATYLYEQYLWGQYPSGEIIDTSHKDNGTLSFNTSDKVGGTRSLQLDMEQSPNGDNGAPYLQFYPYTGGSWRYAKYVVETIEASGTWENNTYNRMKWYIKTPASVIPTTTGQYNFTVGTYFSSEAAGGPTSGNAEVNGNHYYHLYNLIGGVWNQCIFDSHPSSIRGVNGATEHGDKPYPVAADAGAYNYFDLLTRMYFDAGENYITSATSTWLFDDFEFYQESETENEEQVYSVCGSYNSANNTIQLGWNRHKDENSLAHDVKYSFSNIHVLGFANATAAPSGTVSPAGYQGYNGMNYSTTGIDVTGQTSIFIAIRPVGATLFKQIELRLDL